MGKYDDLGAVAEPPASKYADLGATPAKPDYSDLGATPIPKFAAKNEDEAYAHASTNEDESFAEWKRLRNRPMGEKIKDIDPIASAQGVGNFIWNFGKGLAYTVPKQVGGQILAETGMSNQAPETYRAENTLALQQGEESAKATLDKTFGSLAARLFKSEAADPSKEAWLASFIKRNPNITPEKIAEIRAGMDQDAADQRDAIDRKVFQQRLKAYRNQQLLAQGRPLEEGAIAGIYHAAGQTPTEEVGPEALKARGAPPADLQAVSELSAATDPNNILLAAAPGLPGASAIGGGATEVAGKAIAATGRGMEAVQGALRPLDRVRAFLNPSRVVTGAAQEQGAKGLQGLGEALAQQGKELRTGASSPLTTKAATASAMGESAIGVNAQRVLGDTAAHSAATMTGIAPLNVALSEGDPQHFLELQAGAGLFGGLLGGFRRNRGILVEGLKPALQSEGARSLTEAAYSGDTLAQKSAAYVMSLPEAARDATMQTIGTWQGLPIKGGSGKAKLYVLNEADFNAVDSAISGQSPMGGGRGFFYGPDGAAYVNGDYHQTLPNSGAELAHTIGHEFGGHAAINILRAMGSRGGKLHSNLIDGAKNNLMPNGRPTADFWQFIRGYNKRFDPTGNTQRLDWRKQESIDEFISEQAGQLLASKGAAELALPKSISDKITDGVARQLGKVVGIDIRLVGGDTLFGRKEVGELSEIVETTLRELAGMKHREGEAGPMSEPKPTTGYRIKELQDVITEPRPDTSRPLEEMQGWIERQKASRRELSELQDTPAIDPESPVARPDAPAAPQIPLARVFAALRVNGIPRAEAEEWVKTAKGNTVEEQVLDILKRRAEQKFQSSKPVSSETPNGPERTPAPNPPQPETPSPAPVPEQPRQPATPVAPSQPVAAEVAQRTPVVKKSAPTDAEVSTLLQEAEGAELAAISSEGKSTQTKAAQTRVQKAKRRAISSQLEGTGLKVDTSEGTETITGDFDPANPLHRALIENAPLTSEEAQLLTQAQSGNGTPTYIRYRSAESNTVGETTEADFGMNKRRTEYAADEAQTREKGTVQTKVVVPITITVGPKGPYLTMFVPDNVLNNAESIFQWMRGNGRPNPYGQTANEQGQLLLRDMNAYAKNHTNGWRGDGSGPIQQFADTGLPRPVEGYAPEIIPKDRFDILNAALHSDSSSRLGSMEAKSIAKQSEGKALTAVEAARLARMRESVALARENTRWVDPESGETNQLRHDMRQSGADIANLFKSPFENLLPKHILEVGGNPVAPREGEVSSVRPTPFDVDPANMVRDGRPQDKAVAANFLPAETLRDDLSNQSAWMDSQARGMGYPSVNDLVTSDSATFNQLARIWRVYHPRDQRGTLLQTDAARGINTRLYGTKDSDTSRPLAGTREAFRDAEAVLAGDGGAGQSPQEQRQSLRAYAQQNGLALAKLPRNLVPSSERDHGGQEHFVWADPSSGRWVKATIGTGEGMGKTPRVMPDGTWELRNGTPAEYLASRTLWNEVMGDDIRMHGVWDDGRNVSVITSQPDITGEKTTPWRIARAMESKGFEEMGDGSFYRKGDNVAVFDLHEGNAAEKDGVLLPFDGSILHPSHELLSVMQREKKSGRSRLAIDESKPQPNMTNVLDIARDRMSVGAR